jgi:glycosyltransferase involved in cell wall biosynthesis
MPKHSEGNANTAEMKIIHSTGVPFAKDGLGYIAYQRVLEIYKRGLLKKVIAPSFGQHQIKGSCCLELSFPNGIAEVVKRFTSLSCYYLIRDRIFDFAASLYISDADIFHGWTGQALFSMRRAKAKGQITFLERPNSHPLAMAMIMQEEYKKYSVDVRPMESSLLAIQLRECDEADFVIVPSHFAYQSFLKHDFDARKLLLIPFGVDVEKFKPDTSSVKSDIFRVVFVGHIGLRKGVHYLLEAWSQLKLRDAELVVVGWTHPDALDEILAKYQNLPNVSIKDFADEPDVFYHQASVFVFPSIEDGFALVVLEAMACGLPVIVTENTGAKDVVSDGKDGFVIPIRNVNALKEKILLFYKNRELCRQMGEIARKKACQHTWKRYAEQLLSVYRQAIESK